MLAVPLDALATLTGPSANAPAQVTVSFWAWNDELDILTKVMMEFRVSATGALEHSMAFSSISLVHQQEATQAQNTWLLIWLLLLVTLPLSTELSEMYSVFKTGLCSDSAVLRLPSAAPTAEYLCP